MVTPARATPAQEVDGDLVGCGTDTPEFTVNLVGRKGGFWFNNAIYHPDSALASALPVPSALEYSLGATLAPGDYDVSTISVDDHTDDPFRLLFGLVDRSPIESYGLAFDLGGPGEVVTPDRVPDLPDDDNWYADVPLNTEVPLSWSIGPDNPILPQQDPVTPPEVLDRLPGFPLGTVTLDTPQTSVWGVHIGALDGVEPVDAGSIVPYFATFTCTDVDDCDDNYSDANLITLDPTNPQPGESVNVTGEGFEPGVTVDIVLEPTAGPPPSTVLGTSVIGDFDTPEAGRLDATVAIPADLPDGEWRILVISQKCSADRGTTDFVVGDAETAVLEGIRTTQPGTGVSPAANVLSTGSTLATTGSNRTFSLAGLAVGLLALGGVFVMTGGRYRRGRDGVSDSV